MRTLIIISLLVITLKIHAQDWTVNDLQMKSYARIEKLDSIHFNIFKTYFYHESKPYNKLILNVLLNSETKKYNSNNSEIGICGLLNDTLSLESVKNNLGCGLVRSLVLDQNGKELYTEIIESEIDSASFHFILGFDEKWTFDESNLSFGKKVCNISFFREFFNEDKQRMNTAYVATVSNSSNDGNQSEKIQISYEQSMLLPVDWVENGEDSEFIKNVTNAGLVNYSLLYDNEKFDNSIRKNLLRSLCNSALNGKLKAVDFYTHQTIDTNEIVKRLGGEYNKTLDFYIPPTTDDFDAVIFTEDWLIDRQTLSLIKKVKEIALVKYSYEASNKPKRNVLFSIILNPD